MAIHFIADLHLQPSRPQATAVFTRYLSDQAPAADALYILGDLFEYWIGDDGGIPDHAGVIAALAQLTALGVPVYFMRGNRDFAVGDDFARATGAHLLPDPSLLCLFGETTALTHGDLLCTDDIAHQQFRARYTDPEWRTRMLRLPVKVRRTIAGYARWRSRRGARHKSAEIMDVNSKTVRAFLREHNATRLIHGHTHRPADHTLAGGVQRLVLADWKEQAGEVLICAEDGSWRRQALA